MLSKSPVKCSTHSGYYININWPRNLGGRKKKLGKRKSLSEIFNGDNKQRRQIINRKGFKLLACISEGKILTTGDRNFKKIFIPVLFLDITSHILRREHGSTPVDGSSKMTTLDPPMRAMDMDNFLFIPPDNVPTLL